MKTPFVTLFVFFTILFSCKAQIQEGEASYYKDVFEGKKTASGEIFHQNLFTAAHRKLPFGTIINVTNLVNGKSTQVRINDRGPYIRNRIIDVSKSVAQFLGFLDRGVTQVSIEVVGFSENNPPNIYSAYSDNQTGLNELALNEAKEPQTTEAQNSVEYQQPVSTSAVVDETTNQNASIQINKVQVVEPSVKQKQVVESSMPSKNEDYTQIHAEVVDMVKQVAGAKEDTSSTSNNKDKETEKKESTNNAIVDVKQKLDNYLAGKELEQQIFDLNADVIRPGFYTVQVSSLTDPVSTFKLGKILADFYQEDVSIVYKKNETATLYSVAIGKKQTRLEAETMLEEIKDRYPYAFILTMNN